VKVVGGLIDAFETPIAYLSAGFRLGGVALRYGQKALRRRSARPSGAVINFIASGFERVLTT
jgi:hypothetical protein